MKMILESESLRKQVLANQKYVLKNFYNPEVIIPETVNQILQKDSNILDYTSFLERLIPEHKQPKKIAVRSKSEKQLLNESANEDKKEKLLAASRKSK